ncbi:MAG: hypothetical protein ABL909_05850 [Sphingopyxis sp.]
MSRIAETDRRSLLASIAATLTIAGCAREAVWTGGRPADLVQWSRDLVALKDELRSGAINVLEWQRRVEALNMAVPAEDIARFLDVDRLTAAFAYDSAFAETADPVLPSEIVGVAGMRGWFVRIFGLRRGGAIIPHVHNGMVSSHLVIGGSFHARTHDRLEDTPDGVRLRPTRDGLLLPGQAISMSDRRDNQHWLVAQQDRSMTFDVGIVDIPPNWDYGHQANDYHMIFVDPTVTEERDGSVIAPIITFDQASAKFAAG